jgi:hypothetical protein
MPHARFIALTLLLAACHGSGTPREPASAPQTAAADAPGPWIALFDGSSLGAWEAYGGGNVPAGWQVLDGALARVGAAGDIATRATFADFELELEWMISPGGNSGIFFRVADGRQYVWETGPEMQVIDNALHYDGKSALTSAGSNYALHAPARDVTRPIGQWNQVRLVVDGPHVEHWLNGEKLLEYELWSPEWQALVAASKFAAMPGYGLERAGRIALQDHGDVVWYRNVRVREL